MIIKVDDILAPYFDVIDKNTNKRVRLCQWANDKAKTYKILKTDSEGEMIFNKEIDDYEVETIKKNIKIVRKYSIFYIFILATTEVIKKIIRIKKARY